jgi:alanine racemase
MGMQMESSWGNGVGHVMIKNNKAQIVGSVCMDMLMIDVTESIAMKAMLL